ncbi:MAG: hypothetical protein JNJ98_17345 [Gemmatimonadetes bacterium]|nr:hypothetical protein [Gemmatimonadota bacterium]
MGLLLSQTIMRLFSWGLMSSCVAGCDHAAGASVTVIDVPPVLALTASDSVLQAAPGLPAVVHITIRYDSAGTVKDSAAFGVDDTTRATLAWDPVGRRLELGRARANGVVTVQATRGPTQGSVAVRVAAPVTPDTTEQPPAGIQAPALPQRQPAWPADLAARPCTVRPTSASALQTALNEPGSRVICLPMGAVLSGNWHVNGRRSGDTSWSVLRADTTMTRGVRLRGGERLPRLVAAQVNQSVVQFHRGADRWLVQGIEFTTDSALAQGPMSHVFVGEFVGERTVAELPHDVHFSHVHFKGWLHQNVRRGAVLNGVGHVVRDSWCTEIHERNSDSQCLISWNGPGPFLFENNLLEAASENIMFGGADPAIPGLVPCDITVRGNLIRKPVEWRSIGTPTKSGSYLVKLLYESKNACRVLIEGNRLDGSWLDGQTGYAIGLKSVNQEGRCSWCRVTDVTIRGNTIVNVGAGFGLAGAPERFPVDTPLSRILVTGNWIDSLNIAPYNGDARAILLLAKARDIQFVRNTWARGNYSREAIIMGLDGGNWPAVSGFRFDENILPIGTYGVGATAAGEGERALRAAVQGTWSFARNVFIGAQRANYPQGTRWVPSLAEALSSGAGVPRPPVP